MTAESVNDLLIKTYNRQIEGHYHSYHQILIPLKGNIRLIIEKQAITVYYGEALVIRKGVYHQFQAKEDFRFLVINTQNLDFLPLELDSNHFAVDDNTLRYVSFVEKQLTSSFNTQIKIGMLDLLKDILGSIAFHKRIDPRLMTVIQAIKDDITHNHTIASLSKIACLSDSHFRTLFKQQLGCTPQSYITEIRMQTALGIILNTDTPIAIVAQQCGYENTSAFIRRFANYYHQTPHKLRRNNQSLKCLP